MRHRLGIPTIRSISAAAVIVVVISGIWGTVRLSTPSPVASPIVAGTLRVPSANVLHARPNRTRSSDEPANQARSNLPIPRGVKPQPLATIDPSRWKLASAEAKRVAEIDLSQTSWQDPFAAAFWISNGWQFDGRSMSTITVTGTLRVPSASAKVAGQLRVPSADESATLDGPSASHPPARTTFRRPYRKLRLEMEIEPCGRSGPFEIELAALKTDSVLSVWFDDGGVVVSAETSANKGVIARREMDLDLAPDRPGRLGLAATGNRLQIVWNGGRVLTCTQPVAQSGADLQLSLVAHNAELRITDLRLEGE